MLKPEKNIATTTSKNSVDEERSKLLGIMQAEEPEKQPYQPWKKRPWKQTGSKPPAHYVCYTCNTPGHWIWECPNRHVKRTVEVDKPTVVNDPTQDLLVNALKKKHGLLETQNNEDSFKRKLLIFLQFLVERIVAPCVKICSGSPPLRRVV